MSGSPNKIEPPTVNEYLHQERLADFKSEYFDGEVVLMTGFNPRHALIGANIGARFGNSLDGTDCGVYNSLLRVRSSPTQFVYPDVTVVCGELEFHDTMRDVVTNPRLIVEVTSPSTEHHGHHAKWLRYQFLPSLTDYLLVAQERPLVEHFSRDAAGEWRYKSHLGLDGELSVPSLGCRVQLRRIYAGVEFDADEAAEQNQNEAGQGM